MGHAQRPVPRESKSNVAGTPRADAPTRERECGECSLCCRLLRVEPLAKPGGTPCPHLARADDGARVGGCAIHERRPGICRGYRCLWLQGGLEEADRPDRLGAIVDLVAAGESARLTIREETSGRFERSERLQRIADEFRRSTPVRVGDADDPMEPDHPYRMLLPNGDEHRVRGETVLIRHPDGSEEEKRLPWLERSVRRLSIGLQRRRWKRLLRRPMGVPGELGGSDD